MNIAIPAIIFPHLAIIFPPAILPSPLGPGYQYFRNIVKKGKKIPLITQVSKKAKHRQNKTVLFY
jgi:hypothetical protein